FTLNSYADEGMWLPSLLKALNEEDMQELGLKLSPEEIYSVNNSSLKDAIVAFGGFCTAEVISKEGLLLTNHHCGFSSIQSHSTVDKDYLTDGFWAMKKEDELPNEGLYARFLVRIEDVSPKVLAAVKPEMSEQQRNQTASNVMEEIKKAAIENTSYDAEVKPFFNGNEYYLFVYETYHDVRLVGAPPSSIGKFGGDTDNWMWPRQTGDFSLFRIYMSPDGSPTKGYAAENIPFKPKHHLPISLSGVQEGDFAMIMGYPGSTDRYLTSYGVQLALEQSNPTRVKIRQKRLEILKADMDADPAVRIKYASKYASISNYWKYFIGQSKGLKKLHVIEKKQVIEDQFLSWTLGDPSRKSIYQEALPDLEEGYQELKDYNLSYLYLIEGWYGTEILSFSNRFRGLYNLLKENGDSEKIKAVTNNLKERSEKFFKDYHASTDQKVFSALMDMYFLGVPADQHPEVFKKERKKYKGDFHKWAAHVYKKSIFSNEASVQNFLNNPDWETLEKDPAFKTSKSIYDNYRAKIAPYRVAAFGKIDRGDRLFVKGLREMNPEKKYYPDANFTMRLTYGQVLSYQPRDAVHYKNFTTIEGIMQKEDPNNEEFIVPEKLKELYQNKNYGQYATENGDLQVNFITNNDITGGNSGSPVINGKGELIGTAFDGNWEAMSGDIAFEPELQRCINVDIRYVLFIIDKYAGATNLINEMTLVRSSNKVDSEQELANQASTN
ncbi:S46 family peptidase, partial [Xanthovirga aplysinae]|uniref:S46 family peptidase n=1 Tax=Xanthovirga aplysinae TaxID=2529853 RepID=UPI0012BD3D15